MRNRFTKLVATGTAFAAVVAVAGITGTAEAALPVNAAPTAGQTLSVNSGIQSDPFSFSYTGDNACAGDSASGGYRVNTFMVPASVDVSQLTYGSGGPVAPVGVTFARPLYNGNTAQANRTTAPTTGIITAGNLAQPFSFGALVAGNVAVPNGAYKIGLACTLSGVTEEYWETPITVSNSTTGPVAFNWAFGAVPAAPVLGALTPGDQSLTGTFTAAVATPAATYAATTVPATVSTPVTPGTPFTLSGLTNGTSYAVTITATNAAGSTLSNIVSGTPNPGAIPAPVVTAVSAPGQINLSWTTPAAPPAATLTGYIVTASPAVAGSPFTVAAGTNTLVVTAAPGSYTFTVQATYTPGAYVGTVSAPAIGSSLSAQTLIQDLQVVRPVGALVLTQRCGVYGSAAAYTDDTFGALPALAATPANADPGPTGYSYGGLPTGTAPTFGAVADPLFPQYPYPVDGNGDSVANYPTRCGIDLGVGKLITSGPKAGQYFTANGRIAQITVVNTQDVDNGWTLNGRMSAFTRTGGGDSFSGNLLGWNPEVTYDSAPNLDGYDMLVQAGNVRDATSTASTTGLGAASNDTNSTLAQSLAKSNAGVSLGMAVVDARLRLLIPVAANSGTYTGTLTFTTV